MIEICNLRTEKPIYEYDLKVDRSNKILGNQYYMHNESERDLVCEQYKLWIYKKLLQKDKNVIAELERITKIYKKYGKLRLFCWCAPKRCHAETIREIILAE